MCIDKNIEYKGLGTIHGFEPALCYWNISSVDKGGQLLHVLANKRIIGTKFF